MRGSCCEVVSDDKMKQSEQEWSDNRATPDGLACHSIRDCQGVWMLGSERTEPPGTSHR